jgi:hypothetical protein
MFARCFSVDVDSDVESLHRVDVRIVANMSGVILVGHLETMSKRDYIAHVAFFFGVEVITAFP